MPIFIICRQIDATANYSGNNYVRSSNTLLSDKRFNSTTRCDRYIPSTKNLVVYWL